MRLGYHPLVQRDVSEILRHYDKISPRLGDEFWAELRKYYDEGEIIELLAAIGLFNYFNRFNDALRMEPTK